jgi:hypothetical protein
MRKITPRNVLVTLNFDINMLEEEEKEMRKTNYLYLLSKIQKNSKSKLYISRLTNIIENKRKITKMSTMHNNKRKIPIPLKKTFKKIM